MDWKERIMERLAAALAAHGPEAGFVRAEIPIPSVDPLSWLQAQQAMPKLYWTDREGGFRVAGIGAAHIVAGIGADYARILAGMNLAAGAHPHPRYYGGFRFDASAAIRPGWERFGGHWFVVPCFEFFVRDGGSYLACNVLRKEIAEQARSLRAKRSNPPTRRACLAPGDCFASLAMTDDGLLENVEAQLAGVSFVHEETALRIPAVRSRHDRPDRDAWNRAVAHALESFQQGLLEKVVLARESRVETESLLDPFVLLRLLAAAANQAYVFCVQPCEEVAFLGASPERLYERTGRIVHSEALAGTRPRGPSDMADAALGDALLHDDKERREHGFVVDGIRAAFAALCGEVRSDDEASVIRLPNCQHLVRRFEGVLRDGVSDAGLLRALHPSSAVGGYPTDEALEWLRATEPFDRGWYAGPVGWIGPDAAEFAVAIRSARVDRHAVHVYAGAGIVPGSTPESEWGEIENKISTFMNVLGEARSSG